MDGVRLGIRVAASLPAPACVKVKRFEARRRNVKPTTLRCGVKSLGGALGMKMARSQNVSVSSSNLSAKFSTISHLRLLASC